jgi:hypothetical protein
MTVTHDRADIIHFIGRQHGSPALKSSGEPVVLTGHGAVPANEAKKVGWPEFFKAVNGRHLALSYDDASGEHKWISRQHS